MNMAKLHLRIGLRTLANFTAKLDTSQHKTHENHENNTNLFTMATSKANNIHTFISLYYKTLLLSSKNYIFNSTIWLYEFFICCSHYPSIDIIVINIKYMLVFVVATENKNVLTRLKVCIVIFVINRTHLSNHF